MKNLILGARLGPWQEIIQSIQKINIDDMGLPVSHGVSCKFTDFIEDTTVGSCRLVFWARIITDVFLCASAPPREIKYHTVNLLWLLGAILRMFFIMLHQLIHTRIAPGHGQRVDLQ
jgi:hypothetical protein